MVFFNSKRIELLEKKVDILCKSLQDVCEFIDLLEVDLEELRVAYLKHLYFNYHGVEDKNGSVVFNKPILPLEEDFYLRRLDDLVKRAKEFRSTSKADKPFTE